MVCSNKVLLPAPGLPPIKMALPGTTPPPKTRSNSLNPVENRGNASRLISDNFCTRLTPLASPAKPLKRSLREEGVAARRISVIVFHA